VDQTGERADTPIDSVCGIELQELSFRGAGEVGELDLDPRLSANATAAELNDERDCVEAIDTCVVPSYKSNDDGTLTVVTIANTELVLARQLYLDFELVAEERPFFGCVICETDECELDPQPQ